MVIPLMLTSCFRDAVLLNPGVFRSLYHGLVVSFLFENNRIRIRSSGNE